ncbi:hypothetical protein QQF64_012920 [Cirrhinus molitorella]|uniref:Uncharacterized protein n=1 Tax=Cirrhinus molitorella TaxID=172907 RepID=A0ABR3LSX0_9TELE
MERGTALGKREVQLMMHKDAPRFSSACSYGNSPTLTLTEKVLQLLRSVREGGLCFCRNILAVRIFPALSVRGCELSLRGRQFDAIGSATCESVGRRERETDAERDSCEGLCNYSLSVIAVCALAAALWRMHTNANGGYVPFNLVKNQTLHPRLP